MILFVLGVRSVGAFEKALLTDYRHVVEYVVRLRDFPPVTALLRRSASVVVLSIALEIHERLIRIYWVVEWQ